MKLLLFLLLFPLSLAASEKLNLKEVVVFCGSSTACDQRTTRFKGLVGEYRSLPHLKDTLRVMASDGGYQSFTYKLKRDDQTYKLEIEFELKPVINEIDVGFTDRNLEGDHTELFSLKEGSFFERQKLSEALAGLSTRLETMGYPDNKLRHEVVSKGEMVDVNIAITLGEPRIFMGVTTDSDSPFIQTFLKRKFLSLYRKPYDLNKLKVLFDEAQRDLFNYGYYLLNLEFRSEVAGNKVKLKIFVTNPNLFAFDFRNLGSTDRDVIHEIVIDLFKKYKRPLAESTIIDALKEFFSKRAHLNTDVEVRTSFFKNDKGENVQLYRIFFEENDKTRISRIAFEGNKFFSDENLQRMFDKEAFELASLNFYDEEYLSYFQDFLRTQYIKNGFVQARVLDPLKVFTPDKKQASIKFEISEGVQAQVRKIEFSGLPEGLENQITDELSNKVGRPFNPIELVDDIKTVTNFLHEKGYYYAEIKTFNDSDIVKYNRTGTDVLIKFTVDTGPLVRLNRVLYLGNDRTQKKVLAKKISIIPGDIITPSKTRQIETALSSTGLFNTVSVIPLKHDSKNTATDLLVKVSERDYGLIEIAPGYRTDLGIKLSGVVSYQNIGGANRAVSFKSVLNQRTSFSTIDPERRNGVDHFIEHNTTLAFSQSDIFDSLIDSDASMAYQTRRFWAFDANIYRINGTLSREITKRFITSIRYQYEDITQYNASESINEGSFQIGAITPSLTYDLRNRQVNPTAGAFFNLTTEFANPFFFSQKEQDLTINYYKLVSRNRFYIPYPRGTFAISLVGGVQENLARDSVIVAGNEQTQGYIPPIKVFRLTGVDIVRGFTDEEMNRLPTGRDISEVRISDRAYLFNFKLEPRYFINDSLMAGVFYDAGRVFVNQVNFGELRDSVGLSFKVITPVGTLDFDYGIKLLRKKDPNGRLEDPGRFHVSIGFF